MVTLTSQERLQPSLLDRLFDDRPYDKKEPLEARVLTKHALREAVLRDLSWLFNVTNLSSELDENREPLSCRSVVNFGVPPMSGQYASTVHHRALEQSIKQAILDFEPRILRHTLEVELIQGGSVLDIHNQMGLVIRGLLWAQPVPLQILLRTRIDLEEGRIEFVEAA